MSLAPEILFHRYFTERSAALWSPFRGKADLDRLSDPLLPPALLSGLQEVLNKALNLPETSGSESPKCGPFHFDYLDSDVANALAFRSDGYSFIGITIALVEELWKATERIAESQFLSKLLGLDLTPEGAASVQIVLFRTALNFVVCHEYTHHVHGHVTWMSIDECVPSEVDPTGRPGELRSHIQEVDADGHAAFMVLSSLFDSPERPFAIGLLGAANKATHIQDRLLFSCFVAAVVGRFLLRETDFDAHEEIFRRTHPPPASRVNFFMHQAMKWCELNRPHLTAWLSQDLFQRLVHALASALWAPDGGKGWSSQTQFMKSAAGKEYYRAIVDGVTAHLSELVKSASS